MITHTSTTASALQASSLLRRNVTLRVKNKKTFRSFKNKFLKKNQKSTDNILSPEKLLLFTLAELPPTVFKIT